MLEMGYLTFVKSVKHLAPISPYALNFYINGLNKKFNFRELILVPTL